MVDLGRYLPGPLVGRLLADLGARVIKVEEPRSGDPVRQAPPLRNGRSSLATLLLAGLESIALDLEKAGGRAALEALLERADVLLESFRPGTLERFGLAPQSLRKRFPKLVICSLTGWGQSGPHAARAGHDLAYQAMAGSLAAIPQMPAVQTADIVGAWSAATSVLAALLRRQRSGDGCWIDQALLDAAGHAAITGWAAEADGSKPVGEPLMLSGALPCYGLYRTKDGGWLALAALEPHFWRRFCRALGRRDLVLRQYSREPGVRTAVAALIARRSREEWAAFMAEHDIPAEPVLSFQESRAHRQVAVRGLTRPGLDGLLRLGFPARLDGERPWAATSTLPTLGADTDRLVAELDLAPDLSPRRRRAAGIGPKRSLKAIGLRLAGALLGRRKKSGGDR